MPFQKTTVSNERQAKGRASLPGLRFVVVGVVARVQTPYTELFGALSKLSVQCIRSMPVTVGDFSKTQAAESVATSVQLLSQSAESGFNHINIRQSIECLKIDKGVHISRAGIAMFFGCMLNNLQACLFDDKRERKMVNLPLLVSLLSSDPYVCRLFQGNESLANFDSSDSKMGVFGACCYISKEGLCDLQTRAACDGDTNDEKRPRQRLGRSVAASFPPLVTFLRRIMPTPVATSPAASMMSRVRWKDVPLLLGKKSLNLSLVGSPDGEVFSNQNDL